MEENFEEYNRKNDGNTLGIIGFILSLIVCTAIIGLPLSLLALKKRPRGLAIAGVVLGTIFLTAQIGGVYLAVTSIEETNWETVGNFWEGQMESAQIAAASQQYFDKNDKYATKISDLPLAEDIKIDPWGHKYRLVYTISRNGGYSPLIQTPGRDGIWDNDDDPKAMTRSTIIDPETVNEPREDEPKDEALPPKKKTRIEDK